MIAPRARSPTTYQRRELRVAMTEESSVAAVDMSFSLADQGASAGNGDRMPHRPETVGSIATHSRRARRNVSHSKTGLSNAEPMSAEA